MVSDMVFGAEGDNGFRHTIIEVFSKLELGSSAAIIHPAENDFIDE